MKNEYDKKTGRKMPNYKGCRVLKFEPNFKLFNILDDKLELKELVFFCSLMISNHFIKLKFNFT